MKENDKYYLCKSAGYTGWVGVGATTYYNPEFILFEKLGNENVKDDMGQSFGYNRKTKKEVYKKILEIFYNK